MLFFLSLLSPVVFFSTAIILGVISQDYSPSRDSISMLVLTTNGVWQSANFVVCGAFMILLGAQTIRLRSRAKFKKTVGSVIKIFGFVMIGLAIIPTDPTLVPTTFPGVLHFLMFVVVAASFCLSVFKVGIITKKSFPLYSLYSLGSASVVLVGAPLLLVVQEYAGILQRIVVFSFILWFTVSPLIVKYSGKNTKIQTSRSHLKHRKRIARKP